MSIQSPEELAGLQAIGRIVALTLQAMARAVRPGITTAELDLIAARELAAQGAESSPALVSRRQLHQPELTGGTRSAQHSHPSGSR
jgi:methionine aminopeptidase